jgi:hypothetical protein
MGDEACKCAEIADVAIILKILILQSIYFLFLSSAIDGRYLNGRRRQSKLARFRHHLIRFCIGTPKDTPPNGGLLPNVIGCKQRKIVRCPALIRCQPN